MFVELGTKPLDSNNELQSHAEPQHKTDGSTTSENSSENEVPEAAQTEELRRSSRQRRAPRPWWNATALAAVLSESPSTFRQATKGEESDAWISAIDAEIDAIRKNETWTLVPRRKEMNVLTTRWVFRKKEVIDENGTLSFIHKARLVSRGFQQIHGVDYNETFAPVVKFSTLCIFLSMVCSEDLELHQIDVKTAFLNGDLNEDVFMEQPEGFVNEKLPNHVCKLQKALYGLKQSPRQWFAKIDSFLCATLDFQSCPYDPCFYVQRKSTAVVLITLYVDDLLIAGSSLQDILRIKGELSSRFEMKDCGEANICLGLEINRCRNKSLSLCQTRYAQKVLERFQMSECKPVCTPMSTSIDEQALEGDHMDPTLYRQAIGSLMYLMVGTRPDIAFAVGRLSQHMEKPSKRLWIFVKRLLRYLRGSKNLGLLFQGNAACGTNPVGYCDVDWAGRRLDRKSTSGYVFLLGGAAISWKSKKQSVVSTSSAEAEYMSMGTAAQECVWISQVYSFANGESKESPVSLYVYNQGSIKMAKNDLSGNRTKHIDIRYHLVRDLLARRKLEVTYCPSEQMIADGLTKPLDRNLFQSFCHGLGLHCV